MAGSTIKYITNMSTPQPLFAPIQPRSYLTWIAPLASWVLCFCLLFLTVYSLHSSQNLLKTYISSHHYLVQNSPVSSSHTENKSQSSHPVFGTHMMRCTHLPDRLSDHAPLGSLCFWHTGFLCCFKHNPQSLTFAVTSAWNTSNGSFPPSRFLLCP